MNHNSKNTQVFSFLFFQATTPNSDTIYQWPNIRNVPLGHITQGGGRGGNNFFVRIMSLFQLEDVLVFHILCNYYQHNSQFSGEMS